FIVDNIIEGESLLGDAKATEGGIDVQDMSDFSGNWSRNGQLWWRPSKAGEKLTLTIKPMPPREYEVIGYFTKAGDYGNFKVYVNGKLMDLEVKGLDKRVKPSGGLFLGRAAMKNEPNAIVIESTGKQEAAT